MKHLLFLFATVGLLGCGGSSSPEPADTDDSSGSEALACSFGGAWSGTFVGGPYVDNAMTWTFSEDGTVRWTSGDLAFDGTWSIDGDVVSVTDTSESGCTGQLGTFRVTYQGGCDAVVVETVEDPCAPRTTSTNGMTLARD